MISVVVGDLVERTEEAVMRPVRSDLAPLTPASRDLGLGAGEKMQSRLAQLGVVPVGGAVLTPAGDLTTSYLIHTVTADPEEPQTSLTVQKAVRNGLRRAADLGISSLALPPLGLSVGSMGAEETARVLVELLVNHLDEGRPPLDIVIVVANEYEEEVFSAAVTEQVRTRFPMQN